jgi:hypothetical protein
MNSIESDARKRHGDFLYDLTWAARKSDRKWLWGVVAIIALFKLVFIPMAVMAATWYVVSISEELVFGSTVLIGFWPAVLVSGFLSPVLHALLSKKLAFANTSNFIAIAGDMNRIANSAKILGVKIIAKISYLAAGVLALYCALAIYVFNRNRLHTLSVTELDVLGNALSKGGFWRAAEKIHTILGLRHADYSLQERSSEAMQVAVSYALACKWMLGKPGMDQPKKTYLKTVMLSVMYMYDLPEEVTMRLKEALV